MSFDNTATGSGYGGDYGLETISQDGQVPEMRMRSAAQVQDFGRRLWENDSKRSQKRAKVKGLVGGFPPYQASRMKDAGLSGNCNANFNSAGSYMENGAGAFYDLFSEAPGVVLIKTSYGTEEEKEEWSRILSEEADRIFHEDDRWDYEMQRSQWEMVLFGCGPLIWEDIYRVLPRSVSCGDFKVPERTKADVGYYETAWADVDWYPPEAYEFIRDEKAATAAGYDVEYFKRCIANAMDVRQNDQRSYDWEYLQQELKNNSLSYYDDSKVVRVGFCWWKEFDGRITQAIVERETSTATGNNNPSETAQGVKFIFLHRGRYANFRQAMSAMYYDRGNGGYHHSVTGMGTKMYSAMEFENRLICRLMDGAFAPKVLFRPTSTEAAQRMQLMRMGDYGVMSPGYEAVQSPISGFINEGLAMYRASSDLMRSNLSNYRQQPEPQKPGNPETKFGRQLDAYQQSSLSKTTFNRYYRQMDLLYAEIIRRLCDLNSTDIRAQKYQERCTERGVARECFGRISAVEAVRVVGEGSAFLRKSSLGEMASLVPGLPEEGQNNWKNDMIAATCGQRSVSRYNPPKKASKLPSDQNFMALEGISMMKNGIPPIITSSQNPLTFAAAYLNAGTQALESVKQGADPKTVLAFLKLCGPAILAHLKRFAKDPLRQQVWQQIFKQWKKLAELTDHLKKMVQQFDKQQQAQRQKTQQAMTDEQIATAKLQGEEARKNAKLKAQLGRDAVKTRSQLAIADATAASNIHRQNRIAAFQE